MRVSLIAIFALLSIAFGIAQTRPMTKQELARFSVLDRQPTGTKILSQEELEQGYNLRFLNNTNLEVMKVSVALSVYRGSKRICSTKPIETTRFRDHPLPHMGSILPACSTLWWSYSYRIPRKFWKEGDRFVSEITGVLVWDGKGDLHDAGHLYTKMVNTKPADMIGLFERDPSLLKVKSPQDFTPILMALSASDLSLVKYLEKKGAKLNYRTSGGFNALFAACMGGSDQNRNYVKKYCPVDSRLLPGNHTILQAAIMSGWADGAKWLLQNGADPNAINQSAEVPLTVAILEQQPWAIPLLVKYKANIHFRNRRGEGLMHYAAYRPEFLPIIKKIGISVNDSAEPYHFRPLMMAAFVGNERSITWLVQNGADVNATDSMGQTARDYSFRSNYFKTDRFYLEAVAAAKKGKKKARR